MAGVLAAEAEVVAAAEASGSFDSFDDVPAIIAPSASLSGTAPVVAEAATAATATAAIPTHQVAIADSAAWAGSDTGSWTGTGLGMGLTETMSGTASSTGVAVRFASASFDLDDNFDPASLNASYTLAETPAAAALGALAGDSTGQSSQPTPCEVALPGLIDYGWLKNSKDAQYQQRGIASGAAPTPAGTSSRESH